MSEPIDLYDLGWSPARAAHWQQTRSAHAASPEGAAPARVAAQHRDRLRLLTAFGPFDAEISGRLRYTAADETELPGTGDWVAASLRMDERRATVHEVLPRSSAIVRSTPEDRGRSSQLLAANVDAVWLVTSMNRDFNPRRIERTLALVRECGVPGIVVLSKSDLADDPGRTVQEVHRCAPGTDVHVVSARTGAGLDALRGDLTPERTIALLGSSGVGKSTLVNRLAGAALLATGDVRADDDRGRHTTTHRELVVLPGLGVVIDTPGLRELALQADDAGGVDAAFPEIEALLGQCRFHDCGHASEPGCAVRAALDAGTLDPARWAHYQKLEREARHMSRRRDARGRHEERKKHKQFARMVRQRTDARRRD